MSYYVIVKQDGEGCDYTIACGTKVLLLDVQSEEEALNEIRRMFNVDGIIDSKDGYGDAAFDIRMDSEQAIKSVTLLYTVSQTKIDLDQFRREIAAAETMRRLSKTEAHERAEFERLSKKFKS